MSSLLSLPDKAMVNTQMTISKTTQRLVDEDLQAIQYNWELAPGAAYLAIPDELRPYPCPSRWQPKLIAALRRLSELTVGQKERAHALLETYFRARIRCGLYKAQQKGIYACLEVVDVQDAIRSRERMMRGQALENVSRCNSVASSPPGSPEVYSRLKRKFSIRDENTMDAGEANAQATKMRRLNTSVSKQQRSSPTSSRGGSLVGSGSTWAKGVLRPSTQMHAKAAEHRERQRKSYSDYARRQRMAQYGITKHPIKRASVPWIQVPKPNSRAPALHTPLRYPPRTPISALLNRTPSPGCTSARLPPISALIRETDALMRLSTSDQGSHPDVALTSENKDSEQSQELRFLKLELEEQEASLEVARQRHVVAAKKAAVARLETKDRDKWSLPPRPRSSHGRIE